MSDDSQGFENPFGRRSNGSGSHNAGTNGSKPEGMGTRPVPMDDVRSEPLDLVAVQADDEFINALASGLAVSAPGFGGYDTDDHVAAMLAAWKADVDADPIPEIDLDAATAAVLSKRRPSGRVRHLVPVASAAALIVVAITGVSIGAHDSRPGDALFSISKVLYQEEAASYEALDTVEKSQAKAKQALAVGDKEAAAAAVAEGQAAAGTVLAEHGGGEVVQELRILEVEVQETTPGVPNEPGPGPSQTFQGGTGQTTTSVPPPDGTSSSATTTAPQSSGGTGGPGDSGGPITDPRTEPTDKPGTEPEPPGGSSEAPPPPPPPPPAGGGPDKPLPQDAGPPGGDNPKPPVGDADRGPTNEEPSVTPPASSPAEQQPGSAPPTTAPAKPSSQGASDGGISGATMTATGTATPSGEPTTG